MRRVGVLPALVTIGNGYCGLLAIFKIADGDLYEASWLILLAMVFDVLDGKIARMARFTSLFGAYLDSLSDAISFGVAPAFLAKELAKEAWGDALGPKLLTFITAVFALGALLRLARYNVEHASGEGSDREGREVSRFNGLPTPGAAGVIASLVFLSLDERRWFDSSHLQHAIPFLCPVLGCLMVSRLSYVHFGNRFLRGRRDFRYLFGVVILGLLVTKFPHETLAAGFVLYGFSGPVLRLFRKEPEAAEMPAEPLEPS
ncbi:MAG: CDP-diacylglycerol--serine O-phosphatidyltransferase [Planctomycetota bacterium]